MTKPGLATTFDIHRCKSLVNTNCMALAVRGWHELFAEGLTDGGILIGWDHQAVRADLRGTPVGVLTWMKQDWSNAIVIYLAYVVPEMRRRGVHTLMFYDLVDQAKTLGIPQITSGVHIDNSISQDAMRKQGRRAVGMVFGYQVPTET